MPRIQRGNVVLHVKEYEVSRYLTLGYNLTDEDGNVIKSALPNNLATLQQAYLDQQAKIAELEATIAQLNAAKSRKKTTD